MLCQLLWAVTMGWCETQFTLWVWWVGTSLQTLTREYFSWDRALLWQSYTVSVTQARQWRGPLAGCAWCCALASTWAFSHLSTKNENLRSANFPSQALNGLLGDVLSSHWLEWPALVWTWTRKFTSARLCSGRRPPMCWCGLRNSFM